MKYNKLKSKLGKYKEEKIDSYPPSSSVGEVTQEVIPNSEIEQESLRENVSEMRTQAIQGLRKARMENKEELVDYYKKQLERLRKE